MKRLHLFKLVSVSLLMVGCSATGMRPVPSAQDLLQLLPREGDFKCPDKYDENGELMALEGGGLDVANDTDRYYPRPAIIYDMNGVSAAVSVFNPDLLLTGKVITEAGVVDKDADRLILTCVYYSKSNKKLRV